MLLTTADSQANALLALARNVTSLNSSQVDLLVSQLENLLSGPNVSLALGNTSIHIVSSLLDASPETLSKSSNRLKMNLLEMLGHFMYCYIYTVCNNITQGLAT